VQQVGRQKKAMQGALQSLEIRSAMLTALQSLEMLGAMPGFNRF